MSENSALAGVDGITSPVVVGQGPRATVYRAARQSTQQSVAVRVLNDAVPGDRRAAFDVGVVAVAQISTHPAFADILANGWLDDGRPYLVTELAAGSFADDLTAGPVAVDMVMAAGASVAEGLVAAHAAGVVHGHVTPGNLMRFGAGMRLTDFGMDAEAPSGPPGYAPPESVWGVPPVAAGDVYGLCATLYALLLGRPPRQLGSRFPGVVRLRELFDQTLPALPDFPVGLVKILQRGIAYEPGARPPMTTVHEALAEHQASTAAAAAAAAAARDEAEPMDWRPVDPGASDASTATAGAALNSDAATRGAPSPRATTAGNGGVPAAAAADAGVSALAAGDVALAAATAGHVEVAAPAAGDVGTSAAAPGDARVDPTATDAGVAARTATDAGVPPRTGTDAGVPFRTVSDAGVPPRTGTDVGVSSVTGGDGSGGAEVDGGGGVRARRGARHRAPEGPGNGPGPALPSSEGGDGSSGSGSASSLSHGAPTGADPVHVPRASGPTPGAATGAGSGHVHQAAGPAHARAASGAAHTRVAGGGSARVAGDVDGATDEGNGLSRRRYALVAGGVGAVLIVTVGGFALFRGRADDAMRATSVADAPAGPSVVVEVPSGLPSAPAPSIPPSSLAARVQPRVTGQASARATVTKETTPPPVRKTASPLPKTSPTVTTPPAGPTPTATNPETPAGVLQADTALSQNNAVKSPNGRYVLSMQTDGNLVLLDGTTPIWAAGTDGTGADRALMQTDGNFVLYAGDTPKWATSTEGNSGAYLAVQDDGNLVLYNGGTWKWNRFDGRASS